LTILDTNVISELMAPSPALSVHAWISDRRFTGELYVTAISVAEILYGIELLPKGKRRDGLLSEAEAMFAEDFAGRILAFDEQSARVFAEIAAGRRSLGRPITEFDAQIASIARAKGATLATRNTSDFEGCGIQVVNPWVD
jgi:toxin FitB